MRMDRRRRVLRESMVRSAAETPLPKTTATRSSKSERHSSDGQPISPLSLVGYSQEVRGPCQQRLVHYIPVRRSMLSFVLAGSFAAIGLLIGLHYIVWIAGPDAWRATPLSLLLDVRSRVGLAGWVNIQLWLLTSMICGMVFQIRKHRLDDYRAHYRIWLWLAFASILASIEAGTGLTQVVAASLEKFGRVNFGWSGRTLLEISLATGVGLLALRICTELRGSPISQTLWLLSLLCWIPSALLASEIVKTKIRPDYIHLAIGSLWLLGKTLVMLAALIYLRQVYIAAQRRFVERNRLIRQSNGWVNWKWQFKKSSSEDSLDEPATEPKKSGRSRRAVAARSDDAEENEEQTESDSKKPSRLAGIPWSTISQWARNRIPTISAPSFKRNRKTLPSEDQKELPTKTAVTKAPANIERVDSQAIEEKPVTKRSFKVPRIKVGSMFGWVKRIKLPSLSALNPVAMLRLPPQTDLQNGDDSAGNSKKSADSSTTNKGVDKPLPSTSPNSKPGPLAAMQRQAAANSSNQNSSDYDNDDDDDDDGDEGQNRKLSKAERKRLKRLQQEQRRNAA